MPVQTEKRAYDWWTTDHERRAEEEGWNLFAVDRHGRHCIEIQRSDEAQRFADDREAYAWIILMAGRSNLHSLALYLDGRGQDDMIGVPEVLTG